MLVLGLNVRFVDLNLIHVKNPRSNKSLHQTCIHPGFQLNLEEGKKSIDIRCNLTFFILFKMCQAHIKPLSYIIQLVYTFLPSPNPS